MESLVNQKNKRLLTTTLPFHYTNVSLTVHEIYKIDPRSGKKKTYRHWFLGSQRLSPSGNPVKHFETVMT